MLPSDYEQFLQTEDPRQRERWLWQVAQGQDAEPRPAKGQDHGDTQIIGKSLQCR